MISEIGTGVEPIDGESHRNGSCGMPFLVAADGRHVIIQFQVGTDDDGPIYAPPVTVPHQLIRHGLEQQPSEDPAGSDEVNTVRAVFLDSAHGVVVFDHLPYDRTMVAVIDLGLPAGECPTAVLDAHLAVAGDVGWGSNSWRGDHFDQFVRTQIDRCRG